MSGKASGWAWDQDLSIHLKYVLLAYTDKADHQGKDVYPSIRLICEMTGLSRRSIQRNTRELEKLGYLIPDGKGPKGVNKWRIPVNKGVTPTTPPIVKGDIHDAKGMTLMTKGDDMGDAKGVTSTSLNPPLNSSIETSIDSRSNKRPRQPSPKDAIRKALAEHFSLKTGLTIPTPTSGKQRREAGTLWYAPIREICEMSEWNILKGKTIIDITIDRLDGITIASPKSLINTTRAVIAEAKIGKGELRPKELHEMTDAEFSKHLEKE